MMIDWINSINLVSCSLVSTIEDLKSGVVLCDLAALAKSRALFSEVKRHQEVVSDPERSSLFNFSIFFREMAPVLPSGLRYSPKDLLNDASKILVLVSFLKKYISSERVDETFQWLKNQGLAPESPEGIGEHLKNGVVLCLLINKLEGKSEPIKGVHFNPKTISAVQANVNKALNHLKNIEKFSSKFMWQAQDIINGNLEVSRGLLKDIRAFYSIIPLRERNLPPCPIPQSTKHTQAKQFTYEFSTPKAKNTEIEDRFWKPKQWLKTQGFSNYISWKTENRSHDPLRNGVLLIEIVNKMYAKNLPIRSPRENIEKSLRAIMQKSPTLGSFYLQRIDSILNGNEDIIWNLVSALMNLCKGNSSLEEKSHLESSIVNWINSTGVSSVESFEEIVILTQKGILLCDLVSFVMSTVIIGVFRNPKTPKVMLSNIEKALKVLRNHPNVSQELLKKSEDILSGDYNAVMKLMEELHRLADGQPKSKTPYLGKKTTCYKSSTPCKNSPIRTNSFTPNRKRRLRTGLEWVCDVLGEEINVYDPQEFSNGVAFAKLIERLDKCQVSGIDRKPKSYAAALHNVEKVLQILRTKRNFPSKLFFVEQEILNGNKTAIHDVLKSIFQIYKRYLLLI